MPLIVANTPVDISLKDEKFLIFYSSIVDGKLWCPDCVAVDDTVQRIFGPVDGPSALIVYVGAKSEWKSQSNTFRGEPWNVQSIPTIIKLRDSKEVSRIVDSEIERDLATFVKEG